MEIHDDTPIAQVVQEHGMVVTAEDLRQHVYCPRILFFRHVRHITPIRTFKMVRGVEKHEEDLRKKGTRIEKEGTVTRYYNVRILDAKLGLLGVLDYFEVTGGLTFPVELKTGQVDRTPLPPHHRVQLAAQALLLEALTGEPVIKAKAVYVDAKEEVEYAVELEDKGRVLRALDEIRAMVAREEIPNPTPFTGRCVDCEFWNYCQRA